MCYFYLRGLNSIVAFPYMSSLHLVVGCKTISGSYNIVICCAEQMYTDNCQWFYFCSEQWNVPLQNS